MLQRVVCWPITTWNRFWFEDVSPYGLAVYRMGLGDFLLAYFLSFFPHILLLFSKEGIYVPVLAPDIAPSPGIAWLIYGASLAAIGLLTLGYRTTLLTPLVLVLYLEHWCLNLAIKNTAYDRLLILLLVITCFAKLDKVWALSAKHGQCASGAASHVLIPAWPGRLLGLQIAMSYFGSGVWKLLSSSWHTGQMLELTLLGPWGTRVGFWLASIGWSPWVYEAATWGGARF
jgi:hypothetical protein